MRSTASPINGRSLLAICVFVQVGLVAFTILFIMGGRDWLAGFQDWKLIHRARKDGAILSHPENLSQVRLPTAFDFLPHLAEDKSSLGLSYLVSKGRTGVSFVLGIPTVKRDKQSYLLSTLQQLVSNMNESERDETLIIVYIGETHSEYVSQIANQIIVSFRSFVENGLIDIVAPTPSYYPNFEKLRITLNDSLDRVTWRSKQNLDYAFLMAYAQSKGRLYVQLEDDIVTKPGFISTMKQFEEEATAKNTHWLAIDFCKLGFIGKVFKAADLPWLITFFQMFYNEKPVDWLISHFIDTKVCNWRDDCKKLRAKYWLHRVPSLFQHIGKTSSLKGKIQEAKDNDFGKIPLFFPHQNPPATVKTSIVPYKDFQLQSAYEGKTFFWGTLPRSGDVVQFIFNSPTNISKFLFRSGNSENPSDRFEDTTVEVLPENSQVRNKFSSSSDGFIIVGIFDALGIAEGVLDQKIGAVKEIRLHVYSDSKSWAILSEIHLQVGLPK